MREADPVCVDDWSAKFWQDGQSGGSRQDFDGLEILSILRRPQKHGELCGLGFKPYTYAL
jgi:hypothetical protein